MPTRNKLLDAANAELKATLDRYEDELTQQLIASGQADDVIDAQAARSNSVKAFTPKRVNYRKLAFAHYEQLGQVVCAHCGFGIRDVLEVAHLDGNRSNNQMSNLAILCPTCHKMHDLDLILTETILQMRDRPKVVVWAKRMKDAGKKAAKTRSERLKWKKAGEKAAETRKSNAVKKQVEAARNK